MSIVTEAFIIKPYVFKLKSRLQCDATSISIVILTELRINFNRNPSEFNKTIDLVTYYRECF
jgi:hypothetical protein